MKYFVWVSGLRGPEAQLWDEAEKTEGGKPVKPLTKPILLPDQMVYSLNSLMVKYPYEAKE